MFPMKMGLMFDLKDISGTHLLFGSIFSIERIKISKEPMVFHQNI